jgi:ribosomal protein S18 acetylase RimI-like enzyme
MLQFDQIVSASDPHFSNLYDLYISAFLPTERRTCAGLEYELLYEKRFYANALLQNDQFVGFFNFWTFDRFCYIEHFAINPLFRSQHIGSEAMEIFKGMTGLPIVFEVEMPNDTIASRRIHFYERLGFSVLSHDYAQPSYEDNDFIMPMLMMSNDIHFASTHFDLIKKTLYNEVYHYKYPTD